MNLHLIKFVRRSGPVVKAKGPPVALPEGKSYDLFEMSAVGVDE